MKLKDIGEFGFINNIKKSQKSVDTTSSYLGIGDDCAVFPASNNESFVITTDMLIEKKHFLLDKISPYDLGYKSIAVSISDVVSMGAEPIYSMLSIALPESTTTVWSDKFIEGYNHFGIPLIGGDTTSCTEGNLSISVTVIGRAKSSNLKYRHSAKYGDIIAVTRPLGASSAGLHAILNDRDSYKNIIDTHHHPVIDIDRGVWLGKQHCVNAMMDISDGISSDITHICDRSNCSAVLYTDAIPINEATKEICAELNLNALELALSGGEEYSLLITVDEDEFKKLNEEYKKVFNEDLYSIGTITNRKEKLTYYYNSIDNSEVDIKCGFRHF